MTNPRSVLLLTRPMEASLAFQTSVEVELGHSVETVISPVLKIVDHGELPGLNGFATLILTSRHAALRLGQAGALSGRNVATVGERVAALAEEFGARAVVLGRDVEAFLENYVDVSPPCLHCRGVHTRGDLAAGLTARGIPTDEAVIYDQVQQPLSDKALRIAAAGRGILPVFSPRSAALVSGQVHANAGLRVVAISAAAAQEWRGPGEVSVARRPDGPAMVQAVAEAL